MRLAFLVLFALFVAAAPAAAQKVVTKSKGPKVYVVTPDGHGVEEKAYRKQQQQEAKAARKQQRAAARRSARRAPARTAAARQAPSTTAPAASGLTAPPAAIKAEIQLIPPPAKRPR